MCFKISKRQLVILILLVLIGGILNYYFGMKSSLSCKPSNLNYTCPQPPSPISMAMIGFLIFGILTYLIEVIYNYFRRKS